MTLFSGASFYMTKGFIITHSSPWKFISHVYKYFFPLVHRKVHDNSHFLFWEDHLGKEFPFATHFKRRVSLLIISIFYIFCINGYFNELFWLPIILIFFCFSCNPNDIETIDLMSLMNVLDNFYLIYVLGCYTWIFILILQYHIRNICDSWISHNHLSYMLLISWT